MTATVEDIKAYWEVSPPHWSDKKVGTLEWSQGITEHRLRVVPYLRAFLETKKFRGKSVLEIGYGAGSDALEYARAGASVVGVDVSGKAKSLAETRFRLEGQKGTFHIYNGRRLPKLDKQFDLIYSCGVLHHTPFMEDLLSDAYAILAPGGKLKVMLYNKNSLLYHYSILYKHCAKNRTTRILSRDQLLSQYSEFRKGCPHTRVTTYADLQMMLRHYKTAEILIEYPVYDEGSRRKIPITGTIPFTPTGIADVDAFLRRFNQHVSDGLDPKLYGWHLLATAVK